MSARRNSSATKEKLRKTIVFQLSPSNVRFAESWPHLHNWYPRDQSGITARGPSTEWIVLVTSCGSWSKTKKISISPPLLRIVTIVSSCDLPISKLLALEFHHRQPNELLPSSDRATQIGWSPYKLEFGWGKVSLFQIPCRKWLWPTVNGPRRSPIPVIKCSPSSWILVSRNWSDITRVSKKVYKWSLTVPTSSKFSSPK